MTRPTAAPPSVIQFTAPVELLDGHAILRLPEAASAALPSRGQVAVTGSLDGVAIAAVVDPDGRRGHWIRLDALGPAARTLTDGQTVTVSLEPAAAWPEPALPEDVEEALASAPDTAELWRSITPMARWEWVRWVRATRNPATRTKRLGVMVSKLRDGKRRPCCFDLSSCTDPDLARGGKLPEA